MTFVSTLKLEQPLLILLFTHVPFKLRRFRISAVKAEQLCFGDRLSVWPWIQRRWHVWPSWDRPDEGETWVDKSCDLCQRRVLAAGLTSMKQILAETWHGCGSVSSSLCSSVEIHISAHCADTSSCQTAAVSRCATEASWRAAISDPQVNKHRAAVSLTTHHWNVLTLWFARQNYGCISRLNLWVMTLCDVMSLFAWIKFR